MVTESVACELHNETIDLSKAGGLLDFLSLLCHDIKYAYIVSRIIQSRLSYFPSFPNKVSPHFDSFSFC